MPYIKRKYKIYTVFIALIAIILFSGYTPLFNDYFYESFKKFEQERKSNLKRAYNPLYDDFLYINEVDDPIYNFNAKGKCWVLADVDGTDFTSFKLDDEIFNVSYGLNTFPKDFGNEFSSHVIEFNQSDISEENFKWVCVEPLYIAQDNITVNLKPGETFSFYAGGPISILLQPNFSYNWLYLEVDNTIINDIYDTSEYSEIDSEFYIMEDRAYIQFDLDMKPKLHTMKIKGNGSIKYKIMVNFDWDKDLIYDVEEVQKELLNDDLDPTVPNIWGFFEKSNEHLNVNYGDGTASGYFTLSIPENFDENNFLIIDVYNGILSEIDIDGDDLPLKDVILTGSNQPYPISQICGALKPGYHNIQYKYKLGQLTNVSFRIGNERIMILDYPEFKDSDGDGLKNVEEIDNGLNPYISDTDQDNLPDNIDASPLSSLTLDKNKLHQVVIPHDSEKNTMIDMIIEKPSIDYSTYATPRLWNGEYNTSISMAMRLFGNEFITRDELVSFWKYQDDPYYPTVENRDCAMYGDAVFSGTHKIGTQSVFLDGNGDYIACGDYNLPNTLFTACAWIKTRSSSKQVIIGEGIPEIPGFTPRSSSHYVGIYDANEIFYRTEIEFGSFEFGLDYRFEVDGAVNDGEWHFIACVVNGDQLTLYFDNQNHTFTIMNTDTTKDNCWIGSYGGPLSDCFFNGYIDDVRIYERAVWPINIMRLYNNGAGMEKSLGNKEDAWWKLDGNTTDSAMGLYDCVLYGGAIFSGAQKRGTQSIFLDGDGDYLACGDYNLPNTLFTACAWIKTRSSSRQVIIGEGLKGESLGSNTHFLGIYDNNEIYYWTETGAGSNHEYRFNVGTTINDGNWHFIACVVNGSDLTLYFDNQNHTFTIINTDTFAGNCWIGSYGGAEAGSGYWFSGFIDDVRIYDFTLTQFEINWLRLSGFSLREEKAWWKFDGNTKDSSTEGFDSMQFNKYIDTYSLVENYDYTGVGDAIPDSRDPNAEVTFILAKSSDETFEFDITFPVGHPAKEDNAIDLRFDFIWLVTYYNKSSGTSQLLHFYNLEENITILSMVNREIRNVNYKLASPDTMIENQILWALTQNPELEDSINYDFSGDIVGQGIVDYFDLANQTILDRQNKPINRDINEKPIENEVLYVAGQLSNYDILNKINIIKNIPNPSFEVNHSGDCQSYFSFYSISNVYEVGQYSYNDEPLKGASKICYTISWNNYIENNAIIYERRADIKGLPIDIEVITFSNSKVLKITQTKGNDIPLDEIPSSITSQLNDKIIFLNQTFIEPNESGVTIPTVDINDEIDIVKEVLDNRQWKVESSALFFDFDKQFDPNSIDFRYHFKNCFKALRFASNYWALIIERNPKIKSEGWTKFGIRLGIFQVMVGFAKIYSLIKSTGEYEGKDVEFVFRLIGSCASLALNFLSVFQGFLKLKHLKTISKELGEQVTKKTIKELSPYLCKVMLILGIVLEACFLIADILNALTTLKGEALTQKLIEIAVIDIGLLIVLPVIIGIAVTSAWATLGVSLLLAAILFLFSWIPQSRPSCRIIDEGTYFIFPEDDIKRHGGLEVGDKIRFKIQLYNNGDFPLKIRTRFRLADIEGTEYEWIEKGFDWDEIGEYPMYLFHMEDAGWVFKFEQTIISPTSNLKAEIEMTIDKIVFVYTPFGGDIVILRSNVYGPEIDEIDLGSPVLENNIASFYNNTRALPEIRNFAKLEKLFNMATSQYDWNEARKILMAIHRINPEYDPNIDIPIDVNIGTNLRENITVLDPSMGVVSMNFSLDLGGLDDPQKEVEYYNTTLNGINVPSTCDLLTYDTVIDDDINEGSDPFYIEQLDWWTDNSQYIAQQWCCVGTSLSEKTTTSSELRVDVYLDDMVLGNSINDETSYFQVKGQFDVAAFSTYDEIFAFVASGSVEIYNYKNQQWEAARLIGPPSWWWILLWGKDPGITELSFPFTITWSNIASLTDYLDPTQSKWSFRVITSTSFTPLIIPSFNFGFGYAYVRMNITEASAVIDESNYYLEIPNTLVDYNFAAPDGFTITPNYLSQSLNSNVVIDISVDNPDQQLGGIYYFDFNVTLHNSGDLIYTERVPFRVPFIQDLTSPVILIEYKDGDETDGNPGRWNVIAYDLESNINYTSIKVFIDEQIVGNTFGYYSVPNNLGKHTIYLEVKNNNAYKAIIGSESHSVTIIDDDTFEPLINVIYFGSGNDSDPGYFEWNIIDFDNDIGGDNDPGLSEIIVSITYNSTENMENYTIFLLPTESGVWNLPPYLGKYTITIFARDNDNDWDGDSLTAEETYSVTLMDDDITPPVLALEHTGGTTDEAPGQIQLSFSDPESDSTAELTILGPYGFSYTKIYALEGSDTINLHDIGICELGIYNITLFVENNDEDGRASDEEKDYSFIILIIEDDDTAKPIITSFTEDLYSWYGDLINLSFTVTAEDVDSGVGAVVITIGGYTFYGEGTHSVSLPSDFYTLEIGVTDNDNDRPNDNLTAYELHDLIFDLTAPITTPDPIGTEGFSGWFTSDVTVEMTAEDNTSGVAYTKYYIDSFGYVPEYGPFSISITKEGISTIEFYSVDNLGNIEDLKTLIVKIDREAPSTSDSLQPGTPDGDNGWYITPVEVTLSYSDLTSGVVETYYRVNEGKKMVYYDSVLFSEDNNYTIQYWSIDEAGLVESVKSVYFKIDKTAPSTTLTIGYPKHSANPTYVTTETEFELDAIDNLLGSDIKEIKYQIDSEVQEGWLTFTTNFTINSFGSHIIYYYSIDMAGNEDDIKSESFEVNLSELTYWGEISGNYSDPVYLEARLIDMATQLPIPDKFINFTIHSDFSQQTVTAQTNSTGVAVATIILNQQEGLYNVSALFETDDDCQTSSASCDFIIEKEHAYAQYTGDMVVPVDAGSITLRATVFDEDDGNWGDLTYIWVNITILNSLNFIQEYPSQILRVSKELDGVGTASITISNDLPENSYLVKISFKLDENDYYCGDDSYSALIIYEPVGDFVTGGGWIEDTDGYKGNFGFNVKYKKNGLPKGQALYVYREDDWVFIVKVNAWIGMAINSNENYSIFEAKCNIKQINATSGEIVWEGGNFKLTIEVWDNSQDGKEDVFQVRVYDKIGLIYHEAGFDPYGYLMGGNIVIHIDEKK